jgi:hypothetical protein
MTITKDHLETARTRLRTGVDSQFKALAALLDGGPPPPPDDGEALLRAAKITPCDAQNIAGWKITSDLNDLIVEPGKIRMGHTMHDKWPLKTVFGGKLLLYGNAWVIAQGWAATWEWFARREYTKYVNGDDLNGTIKEGGLDHWKPIKGEPVAIFVSTLARYGARSINERSQAIALPDGWPY